MRRALLLTVPSPVVSPAASPAASPVGSRAASPVAGLVVSLLASLLVGLGAPAAHAADRDCADFGTQAGAQRFHDDNGPGDPHRLDADGDGRACESLPCPCSATSSSGDGGGTSTSTVRQHARVVRIVDGDTFVARLAGGRRTVRMLGIDTPETGDCLHDAATRRLARMIPRGTRVLLVSDPSQDLRDRYGRLLRYTTRVGTARDVNRAQVWHGMAKVYVYDANPFRRTSVYRRAQQSAVAADRGVWGRC